MGSISIVHGIIKIRDINSYKEVVESMELDDNYPWIRPEMLNLCGEVRPYYYENPIATFGATYKDLDGGVSWSELILKFEYLLTQIDFDFARISLETEIMGDYGFFWGAKRGVENELYSEEDLIESDKWFFGYGKRDMFGRLEEQEPKKPFDFQYPLEFNQPTKEEFNSIIPELNQLEPGRKTFIEENHNIFGSDHSHLILTYLKINKVLCFGWEPGQGLYIERLKEIKELTTPYDAW
ncbi:MAG: hypothetical protein PQJ50_11060 [Spirochaetales bacterium]|nr:hypothetical protein [Spirochaetales bacterium]